MDTGSRACQCSRLPVILHYFRHSLSLLSSISLCASSSFLSADLSSFIFARLHRLCTDLVLLQFRRCSTFKTHKHWQEEVRVAYQTTFIHAGAPIETGSNFDHGLHRRAYATMQSANYSCPQALRCRSVCLSCPMGASTIR